MPLISDITVWLDEVDLWTEQEARDLFAAVRDGRPTGLFHCACTADGEDLVVRAPHATSALLLQGRQARLALLEAVTRCEALALAGADGRAQATAAAATAIESPRRQHPSDRRLLLSV